MSTFFCESCFWVVLAEGDNPKVEACEKGHQFEIGDTCKCPDYADVFNATITTRFSASKGNDVDIKFNGSGDAE
jgi:hypothetical protein